MSYTEPRGNIPREPVVVNQRVNYHDRVRWGPIFAGIVISIATQLILSALGAAIGLGAGTAGSNGGNVAVAVGIWATLCLLISLFIGSWVMGHTCGPINNKTALLNGAILWATTLAISSWLLASGISGTFGAVAANSGEILNQVQEPGGVDLPNRVPTVDPAQARNLAANAAKTTWSFLIGSLLGLAASLLGVSVGARKPRVYSSNLR